MKTADVYDFCLDWQMAGESRNIQEFKARFAEEFEGDFFKFSAIARTSKWYVKSMDMLADKESK